MSTVYDDNQKVNVSRSTGDHNVTVRLHLPDGAVGSPGTDGELIAWRQDTGDEFGFWKFKAAAPAGAAHHQFTARGGYHYNTQWSGVPPSGFHSRGAGVPYMVGLLR